MMSEQGSTMAYAVTEQGETGKSEQLMQLLGSGLGFCEVWCKESI
jgi:hypothetical protein